MRVAIALLLLVIGILGVLIPVIPGVPFLIAFLYVSGILSRRRFLRIFRKYRGKKGSLQRRLVGWIMVNLMYRKGINLK